MVLHIRRRVWWGLCALILSVSAVVSSLPARHRAPADTAAANRIPIVTVDAGHGGFDGGASVGEVQEKTVNLQIALPLADMLRLCGMRVVLTRDADEALCEDDRRPIREKKVSDMKERLRLFEEADINLSIHQNSFAGSSSHGTQMFYSANHTDSERLAQALQTQVVTRLQPDNHRPIKSGNRDIYLLHKTTVPTVLIECGFLSNPEECTRLCTASYQSELAWAIAMGTLAYRTTQTKEEPT